MLKKTIISSLLIAFLVALSGGLAQATTVTIATFADPAEDSSTPLFTVSLVDDLITGGWADTQTGLDLIIFGDSGNPFENAFFEMTDVSYTGELEGGVTGDGTIRFFVDNQDTSTEPLIQIDFDSGHVTPFGFAGMDLFYADEVTITGSEIVGSLTDESFAFSFANQVPIDDDLDKGFTATAAFTSSAVPEPATIALLGLGALSLIRKRKK